MAHFGKSTGENALVQYEERTYEEELEFLEKVGPCKWLIKKGFVPNMRVPGVFYVNEALEELMLEELRQFSASAGTGGFLPAVKQIANVAALPGCVGHSVGLPDVHSGYGFAIGNMAAFDMGDPEVCMCAGVREKCLFILFYFYFLLFSTHHFLFYFILFYFILFYSLSLALSLAPHRAGDCVPRRRRL